MARPRLQTTPLCLGKHSIIIDSKNPSGKELLRKMISSADVLIDPFRPGVLERLGLKPVLFLGRDTKNGLNEKLIYARICQGRNARRKVFVAVLTVPRSFPRTSQSSILSRLNTILTSLLFSEPYKDMAGHISSDHEGEELIQTPV